jgi:penicillin-binding protein 2
MATSSWSYNWSGKSKTFHGRVIEAPTFKKRNDLNLSPIALETTHDGMRDVVHASYGTGQRANLGFTTMCGKTGTAQWKDEPKQGLAWFSGFFPYENPRYAFAAVYEGAPGEIVGGGRKAAPMVSRFFLNFQTEIEENLRPAARAMIISEEDGQPIIPEDMIPKAIVVEDEEALLGDPTNSLATPGNNEIPVIFLEQSSSRMRKRCQAIPLYSPPPEALPKPLQISQKQFQSIRQITPLLNHLFQPSLVKRLSRSNSGKTRDTK